MEKSGQQLQNIQSLPVVVRSFMTIEKMPCHELGLSKGKLASDLLSGEATLSLKSFFQAEKKESDADRLKDKLDAFFKKNLSLLKMI